jgi:hypothetical protein
MRVRPEQVRLLRYAVNVVQLQPQKHAVCSTVGVGITSETRSCVVSVGAASETWGCIVGISTAADKQLYCLHIYSHRDR